MKRLVSFLFLSLLATIVLAQPQAPDTMWTRTFGGFNSDEGKKVLQTLDGGYIIVGSCGDVYLIKTDANGNEQWERFYGGTGTEYGNSIKITSDGGYIIVGQTQVLSYYVYLLKTDSSGNLLWERQIGNIEDDCSGWDIDLTTDGGYIICGWCYMDTSVNVYTDGFLAKADSLGNLLWYRTYGGNYGDWLISLQVCPDGGFVACGYKTINPPYNDFYLVKTDSLGNTEWERIITGNPSSCAYDVQITNDGGYIFAGAIGIAVNNCDVYLIKTDSLGDEQWHSIIGGTGNDGGESVCETFDGGYVIVGTSNSFFTGTSFPGGNYTDFYFLKTNSVGVLEWQMAIDNWGYDFGHDLQPTTDGGFILVGTTQTNWYDVYLIKMGPENLNSSISLSLTPVNPPVQIPAGGGSFQYNLSIVNNGTTTIPFDLWIEIDPPNKGPRMFRQYNNLSLLPGDSICQNLTQSVPGSIVAGTYNYMAFIGTNAWVILDSASFPFVKLGSKGFIDDTYFADWDLTGWDADIISDFPLPSQFKLYAPYPNPFNTSVTITFYLPSTTNVKLTVYDITGRVVTIIDPGHLTLGSNNVEWDASGQASGIYFVQFKAGDFAQTQKILLLR